MVPSEPATSAPRSKERYDRAFVSYLAADYDATAKLLDGLRDRSSQLLLAKVHLKRHAPADAIGVLTRLAQHAESGDALEIDSVLALAHCYAGQTTSAHSVLARAKSRRAYKGPMRDELSCVEARVLWAESRYDEAQAAVAPATVSKAPNTRAWANALEAWISRGKGRFDLEKPALLRALSVIREATGADMQLRAKIAERLAILYRETFAPELRDVVSRELADISWSSGIGLERYVIVRSYAWGIALEGDQINSLGNLNKAVALAPGATWRALALLDRAALAFSFGNDLWARLTLDEADALARTIDWETAVEQDALALVYLAELWADHDVGKAAEYLARYSTLRGSGKTYVPSSDVVLTASHSYAAGLVHAAQKLDTAAQTFFESAHEIFAALNYRWRSARAAFELYRLRNDVAWLDFAKNEISSYPNSWLAKAIMSAPTQEKSGSSNLNPAERAVFDLIAEGRSRNDVARALGKSPKTIAVHISSILRAYGVANQRELLARIRGGAGHAGAESDSSLTPTQGEVLALACRGLTTLQIAESLGRSHFTVKNHLKAIYKALGVKNRAGLAAHRPLAQTSIIGAETVRRRRLS